MSTAVATRETAAVAVGRQLEAMRQIAEQRTPSNEIRTRPGKGGKQLKYTDSAYVIRTLNEAFSWDWDFVADNEQLIEHNGVPFEVKVRGTLTVRLNGQAVTKTQFGSQPIEMLSNGVKPVSIGDCYKGAASDALKKCASLLGIALDLYDSDSDTNTGKQQQAPQSQPARQQQPTREAEPEPVRNVKLEGAQPTDSKAQWPKAPGLAGQIFAKCQALNWTAANLADEIEERFKMVIPEESLIAGLADSLTPQELKTLDQALAAEFNNRSRTR